MPPGRGIAFCSPPPCGRGPPRRSPSGRGRRCCGLPIPWLAANGLFPGRGAFVRRGMEPGVAPPVREPALGAAGFGTPGFGALGFAAPGFGALDGFASAPGFAPVAGFGCGVAGLGAPGLGTAPGRGAVAPGFGAAGLGALVGAGLAPGSNAPGVALGARMPPGFGASDFDFVGRALLEDGAFGASFLADSPSAPKCSRIRRTTGASSDDDAPRTYSP